MEEIVDRVYIGSLYTVRAGTLLKANGITHVVSALTDAANVLKIGNPLRPNITTLQLDVDDTDDEDLLRHIPTSNTFITAALEASPTNKVMIHCVAGVSRSATLLAAYLMSTLKIGLDDALRMMREKRPQVEPNPGFMRQLGIYESEGCPHGIEDTTGYRRWKREMESFTAGANGRAPVVAQYESVERTAGMSIGPVGVSLPGQAGGLAMEHAAKTVAQNSEGVNMVATSHPFARPTMSSPSASATTRQTKDVELRCKKCSHSIAQRKHIILHTPEKHFSTRRYSPQSFTPQSVLPTQCGLYFLDPIIWMKPELDKGEIEGKFGCPKCGSKIGNYAWQGMTCSCGEWITPGLAVQRGRVDEVPRRGQVMLPPRM
ncbi:phosphatases II [Saitoella complicata NRRL Y-17804]|uniref:protein-tyrosine-phosphatase n=1 Tax=Saitoella complicata (strain BCRC 22490 / CBS 7301 / JCM 7358 / NBRC 10748 / NRRL Y-17804) TaxID=698492 RepID=A0A0E9NF36_SAICN|nr:phosphatases II [Saitoella complicata NRRL Y-17804]ODQ52904.1 phosphatases II [Saitoella complicata NRRL Y-17804]GAO48472.1 hypothetical protein G7K_2645-t1 [Saitoella complicata NRRL Y-17804]